MKISDMKNISTDTAELLASIGITSKDGLETAGAVDTYLRLKNLQKNADLSLLYTLEAALLDIPVDELSNDIKQHLQAAIKAPRL